MWEEVEAESLVVGLEAATLGTVAPWLLISASADLLRLVMPTELVQTPCLTASLSAAPRFVLLQLCVRKNALQLTQRCCVSRYTHL